MVKKLSIVEHCRLADDVDLCRVTTCQHRHAQLIPEARLRGREPDVGTGSWIDG
jgi:hypothetical protein